MGTRLRPLTDACPKPLLPVRGRPVITLVFDHLIASGIRRIIINTHHCAERYREVFPSDSYRDCPLIFRHEPVLLETAGGIANICHLLDPAESLLVYNGDVLTTLPLDRLMQFHQGSNSEVSLALRSSGGPLHVSLDNHNRVVDIRNTLNHATNPGFLFTGIYLVEPGFIRRLKPGVRESVIPVFLDMIRHGQNPRGIVLDEGTWSDMGPPEEYHRLNQTP